MKFFVQALLFCLFSTAFFEHFLFSEEKEHHKFVVITPQKTGTHFLMPILRNMLGKNTKFVAHFNPLDLRDLLRKSENKNIILQFHCKPGEKIIRVLKNNHYKVLFLWRDPRDQVLSMLFRVRGGRIYGPLNMQAKFGQLSFEEQLHEVITGERFGFSVTREMMLNRKGWLYQDPKFVHVIHFENLIGKEGGGSPALQLEEVAGIARYLHVKLNKNEIKNCVEGVFGNSGNFRSGQIGEWKIYFSEQHKHIFKELYGDSLIETGYEQDYNW